MARDIYGGGEMIVEPFESEMVLIQGGGQVTTEVGPPYF